MFSLVSVHWTRAAHLEAEFHIEPSGLEDCTRAFNVLTFVQYKYGMRNMEIKYKLNYNLHIHGVSTQDIMCTRIANAWRAGYSPDPFIGSGPKSNCMVGWIRPESICRIWPRIQMHGGLDMTRAWARGKGQIWFTSGFQTWTRCDPDVNRTPGQIQVTVQLDDGPDPGDCAVECNTVRKRPINDQGSENWKYNK